MNNPVTAPLPEHPTIETARLVLRPLVASDAAALHLAFSDPETTRYLDFPTSRTMDETAFRVQLATIVMPQWHATWALVAKPGTGTFGSPGAAPSALGIVTYHHRESGHRRLEIGYVLARPYWRQGLASEAVRALLSYCFEGLGMHRVEATVDPENLAGMRFAERLGFRCESSRLRDRLFVGGRYRDVVMYGLLDAEWRAGRAAPAQHAASPGEAPSAEAPRRPYAGGYLL